MNIESSRFGWIEFEETNIFAFPNGIPGFEQDKRYVFLQPDPESPMTVMQSVDQGSLSFIVVNPFLFRPDYEFDIPDPVMEELEIQQESDVAVWCIISAVGDVREATINLLAPIIVNSERKLGKQVILYESLYDIRETLFAINKG